MFTAPSDLRLRPPPSDLPPGVLCAFTTPKKSFGGHSRAGHEKEAKVGEKSLPMLLVARN